MAEPDPSPAEKPAKKPVKKAAVRPAVKRVGSARSHRGPSLAAQRPPTFAGRSFRPRPTADGRIPPPLQIPAREGEADAGRGPSPDPARPRPTPPHAPAETRAERTARLRFYEENPRERPAPSDQEPILGEGVARLTADHLEGMADADLAKIGLACLHEFAVSWHRAYPTDRHGFAPVLKVTKRWLDDPTSVNWTEHFDALNSIRDARRLACYDRHYNGHIPGRNADRAAFGVSYLLWINHRGLPWDRWSGVSEPPRPVYDSSAWTAWATAYACDVSADQHDPIDLAAQAVADNDDPRIGPLVRSYLADGRHGTLANALEEALAVLNETDRF